MTLGCETCKNASFKKIHFIFLKKTHVHQTSFIRQNSFLSPQFWRSHTKATPCNAKAKLFSKSSFSLLLGHIPLDIWGSECCPSGLVWFGGDRFLSFPCFLSVVCFGFLCEKPLGVVLLAWCGLGATVFCHFLISFLSFFAVSWWTILRFLDLRQAVPTRYCGDVIVHDFGVRNLQKLKFQQKSIF